MAGGRGGSGLYPKGYGSEPYRPLEANFEGSQRTARDYMRVAENWNPFTNRQRAADLSLRAALAELTESLKSGRAATFHYRPLARGMNAHFQR